MENVITQLLIDENLFKILSTNSDSLHIDYTVYFKEQVRLTHEDWEQVVRIKRIDIVNTSQTLKREDVANSGGVSGYLIVSLHSNNFVFPFKVIGNKTQKGRLLVCLAAPIVNKDKDIDKIIEAFSKIDYLGPYPSKI